MDTMEAITIKIANLEKGQEKQDTINKNIFVKLDAKIGREESMWFIGIMITVLALLIGYLSWQISEFQKTQHDYNVAMQNEQSKTNSAVSYIEGVFKNYDLKINN